MIITTSRVRSLFLRQKTPLLVNSHWSHTETSVYIMHGTWFQKNDFFARTERIQINTLLRPETDKKGFNMNAEFRIELRTRIVSWNSILVGGVYSWCKFCCIFKMYLLYYVPHILSRNESNFCCCSCSKSWDVNRLNPSVALDSKFLDLRFSTLWEWRLVLI